MNGQSLFNFAEDKNEKNYFYFSVLHYPKEICTYNCKNNLPQYLKNFIRIEDKENAIVHLTHYGLDRANAENIINYIYDNIGKVIVYLTHDEMPIF